MRVGGCTAISLAVLLSGSSSVAGRRGLPAWPASGTAALKGPGIYTLSVLSVQYISYHPWCPTQNMRYNQFCSGENINVRRACSV